MHGERACQQSSGNLSSVVGLQGRLHHAQVSSVAGGRMLLEHCLHMCCRTQPGHRRGTTWDTNRLIDRWDTHSVGTQAGTPMGPWGHGRDIPRTQAGTAEEHNMYPPAQLRKYTTHDTNTLQRRRINPSARAAGALHYSSIDIVGRRQHALYTIYDLIRTPLDGGETLSCNGVRLRRPRLHPRGAPHIARAQRLGRSSAVHQHAHSLRDTSYAHNSPSGAVRGRRVSQADDFDLVALHEG